MTSDQFEQIIAQLNNLELKFENFKRLLELRNVELRLAQKIENLKIKWDWKIVFAMSSIATVGSFVLVLLFNHFTS